MKQDKLQSDLNQLKQQSLILADKLKEEESSHQKAKEGLSKAGQAIGKLRAYAKEQDNKIAKLDKLNTDLGAKVNAF